MNVNSTKLERADDLAEINQRVGHTLGILQLLEDSSVLYFVLKVRATKAMGTEAGSLLIEKAGNSTFGGTITEMVKSNLLTGDLKDQFLHIRNERNWLVHRSLNQRHQAMNDYSSLLKLMDRMRAIGEEANRLMTTMAEEAEAFLLETGIDPNQLADEIEKLGESWSNPHVS